MVRSPDRGCSKGPCKEGEKEHSIGPYCFHLWPYRDTSWAGHRVCTGGGTWGKIMSLLTEWKGWMEKYVYSFSASWHADLLTLSLCKRTPSEVCEEPIGHSGSAYPQCIFTTDSRNASPKCAKTKIMVMLMLMMMMVTMTMTVTILYLYNVVSISISI